MRDDRGSQQEVRVAEPGYYFSERLGKLVRLGPGGKLPLNAGPWIFFAPEGVLSSSEVVRDLLSTFPDVDPNRLSFKARVSFDRRNHFPHARRTLRAVTLAVGCLALGVVIGRLT